MYELNRARLVGIGPRGARYTDVTLDLSGLGEPVPPSQPVRRRRPTALAVLAAAAGERRRQVGAAQAAVQRRPARTAQDRRRRVPGQVRPRQRHRARRPGVDARHHRRAPGHRQGLPAPHPHASNNNPLAEAWYSFRPSDTLDLATLPVTVGRPAPAPRRVQGRPRGGRPGRGHAPSWPGSATTRAAGATTCASAASNRTCSTSSAA